MELVKQGTSNFVCWLCVGVLVHALYITPERDVQRVTRPVLIFGNIWYISETVQDRDIVAMED